MVCGSTVHKAVAVWVKAAPTKADSPRARPTSASMPLSCSEEVIRAAVSRAWRWSTKAFVAVAWAAANTRLACSNCWIRSMLSASEEEGGSAGSVVANSRIFCAVTYAVTIHSTVVCRQDMRRTDLHHRHISDNTHLSD